MHCKIKGIFHSNSNIVIIHSPSCNSKQQQYLFIYLFLLLRWDFRPNSIRWNWLVIFPAEEKKKKKITIKAIHMLSSLHKSYNVFVWRTGSNWYYSYMLLQQTALINACQIWERYLRATSWKVFRVSKKKENNTELDYNRETTYCTVGLFKWTAKSHST